MQQFSRRAVLRSYVVTTAGAALMNTVPGASATAAAEQQSPSVSGPGAVPVVLTINGSARTIAVEPRTTLAEALRGPIGMTGTKIACNRGACSACTVWLDGAPVCSCMMLAVEAEGHAVTTIEGLVEGEALHPVQAAFIDHDALQCGFCTPGLIMSCVALLERTPHPTVDDVEAAIAGHYCRCGTYPHVVAATLAAAKPQRS